MEVVAVESSGTQRKSTSMEHKSSCPATEGYGNAAEGGPHESLPTLRASTQKTASSTWGCGTRSEQELKPAHQNAKEEVVKKQRKNAILNRVTEALAPQQLVRVVKDDAYLLIHRNFICWSSVPGVHLKMILGSLEKIACSALNLKVLLEPGQRELHGGRCCSC